MTNRPCDDPAMDEPEHRSRDVKVGVVLRPGETRCEVSFGAAETSSVEYSSPFRPRAESLTPGHLVAVTTAGPNAASLIIWRWFDAVVVEQAAADEVRLWEPNHGEVLARPRDPLTRYPVGTRAYASAGLPGADWWVEGLVRSVEEADVAIDPVREFYESHGLWSQLVSD